jgi:hypothetical protein
MNRFLLTAVKAIISIVVLYGLLSFLGGFSDKQSVLLALLFYGVYSSLSTLSAVKQPKFVPFSVFVAPKLVSILQDFELVKPCEEGWTGIREGIDKLPEKDWNIWRKRGFSFSFVTQELIYNQDGSTFSAEELDVGATLAPAVIVRDHEAPNSMFRNYSPHLNLRAGLDFGCIVQLTLPDWYWDKIKTSEILKTIPKGDVSKDHMCGTVDVTLARLPRRNLVFIKPWQAITTTRQTSEQYSPESTRARILDGRESQLPICTAAKQMAIIITRPNTAIAKYHTAQSSVAGSRDSEEV